MLTATPNLATAPSTLKTVGTLFATVQSEEYCTASGNALPNNNASMTIVLGCRRGLVRNTAMPVATPCPATAPSTTPAGEEAAASAMVARNDLSPHSAANTSANVDSSSAPAHSGRLLSL